MDFNETIRKLAALSGKVVEAEVWGLADGSPVMFVSGELMYMRDSDYPELPPKMAVLVSESESAETFFIGSTQLCLWRKRFIDSERMPHTDGWLELRTQDALLRIGPLRVPD